MEIKYHVLFYVLSCIPLGWLFSKWLLNYKSEYEENCREYERLKEENRIHHENITKYLVWLEIVNTHHIEAGEQVESLLNTLGIKVESEN